MAHLPKWGYSVSHSVSKARLKREPQRSHSVAMADLTSKFMESSAIESRGAAVLLPYSVAYRLSVKLASGEVSVPASIRPC